MRLIFFDARFDENERRLPVESDGSSDHYAGGMPSSVEHMAIGICSTSVLPQHPVVFPVPSVLSCEYCLVTERERSVAASSGAATSARGPGSNQALCSTNSVPDCESV